MHEHVAGAHRCEDVEDPLVGQQSGGDRGRPGGVLQLGAVERCELEKRAEVERRVYDLHVALIHLELADQQVADLVRHPLVDLQAHHER